MNNISNLSRVKQSSTETAPKETSFSYRLSSAMTEPSHNKTVQPSRISRNFKKTHPNIGKNVRLPEISPKKPKLAELIKNTPTHGFKVVHQYMKLNGTPEMNIGDKIDFESKLCVEETLVAVNHRIKSDTPTKCCQAGCDSKKVTFSDQSADETFSRQFLENDKLQSKVKNLRLKDVSNTEEQIKSSDEDTFKTAGQQVSFDKTLANQRWTSRNSCKYVDPLIPSKNDPYRFQRSSPRNMRTSNSSDQFFEDHSHLRKGLWRKVWPSNKLDSDFPFNKHKIMQQHMTLDQPDQSSDYSSDTNSTEPSYLNQGCDHSHAGALRNDLCSKVRPSNKSIIDMPSNKSRNTQKQITLKQSGQPSDYSSVINSCNLCEPVPLNQLYNHSYAGRLSKGFWNKMWPANSSYKSTSDSDISLNKSWIGQKQTTSDQSDQSSVGYIDTQSVNPHEVSLTKRHSWSSSYSSSETTSVIFGGRRKWPVEEGSNRNYIRALVHCDSRIRTDEIKCAKNPPPHWIVNYDNANYIKSFMSPHPQGNMFRI